MKAFLGSPASSLNNDSNTKLNVAETRDENCPFSVCYAFVAHFYTELPPEDFSDSDRGKAKAQQKIAIII